MAATIPATTPVNNTGNGPDASAASAAAAGGGGGAPPVDAGDIQDPLAVPKEADNDKGAN